MATDGAGENAAEVKRVLDICNACRYCEGFCATFQVLSSRRKVEWSELDYLSNLCHNCTACYHACQYSPPHEFNVNAPLALSRLRAESYQRYAWPGFLGSMFQKNGLVVSLATALILALTMLLGSTLVNREILLAQHQSPGAFYQVVSHEFIVASAGSIFLFAVLAMALGVSRFWGVSAGTKQFSLSALWGAFKSAATLNNLGGGHGQGCNTANESFSNKRRIFHQFTMWGFLLCFAATCSATFYEYILGQLSPFPYFSLPVVLGTAGGLGLLVGPAGLAWIKTRSDPRPMNLQQYGMDYAFLALLFLISLTGLVLLAFRETAAMGVLLLIHLGFVFSFFVTLPYGKFVHGIYRFAALVMFYSEQHQNKDS
ncbi:MAG: tricarballylate utilization 4Fe-4S protein TcuB [Gammaproteobacteria bacterium]|nr:tricarballylate utilization 4Fe-4S protein TcuB [Gammaproteobacteria bacterium]